MQKKSNAFGKFMYYSTTGQNLVVLLLISGRKIDLHSQTGSTSCCNVYNVSLKSIMKTIHSAVQTLCKRNFRLLRQWLISLLSCVVWTYAAW